MALTVLAWFYITILCWTWGDFIINILQFRCKEKVQLHYTLTCFTGMSAIAVVAGFLSLQLALSNIFAQALIIIPALIYLLTKRRLRVLANECRAQLESLPFSLLLLLGISVLMMLVMSVWEITHPDTLGYHAQLILWIEKYKAIPGLVNLHVRYGYQSLWFVLCAFFNLNFLGSGHVMFINTTVLFWYMLFVVQQLNESIKTKRLLHGVLWLFLLAISLWSYTQVRLTATSASPDFIATLYCWLLVYLFISYRSSFYLQLVFLLSVAAITIKLSAAPVLLFAVYALAKQFHLKKKKAVLFLMLTGIFIMLPFLVRNLITSGYSIFPSPVPDLAAFDWKYDKERTRDEKDFIKAYAKVSTDRSKQHIKLINEMPLQQWLPRWWQSKSPADKLILATALLCLFFFLLFAKRMIRQMDTQTRVALLLIMIGLLFWFFNAPDPRFGFGFIIPFCAIILLHGSSFFHIYGNKFRPAVAVAGLLALLAGGYTAYRLRYYFKAGQIVQPAGLKPVAYKNVTCNGVLFNIPEKDFDCGSTPVPCADDCQNFIFRGSRITDGFKQKN